MYLSLSERELEIACNNLEVSNPNQSVDYKNKVCIKPWGHEFLIYQSTKIAIWYVTIKRGYETSLHCHFKKDTLLITLSGAASVKLLSGEVIPLNTLEPMFIPRHKFHGLSSLSGEVVIMEIEIFSNELTFSDKNDLLRIEDPFKREKTGYEKSVQVEMENLDNWGHFYLDEGLHKYINSTSISTHRIENNDFTKVGLGKDDNSMHILLEGEVFSKNSYTREGSIISPDDSMYSLSKITTVLSIRNLNKMEDSKIIYSTDHLKLVLRNLRDKRIILTSGCFDILHIGHLHSLKVAKSLGDTLMVCLSNDDQIKRLKGPSRPVNSYADRIDLFKTIRVVDYIILYNEENVEREDTLDTIMQIVDPYKWVKGSDYTLDGIKKKHPSLRDIHLIDNIENKSTTTTIRKIIDLKE